MIYNFLIEYKNVNLFASFYEVTKKANIQRAVWRNGGSNPRKV